ncbi:MAG TPA: dTMP kinase [Armatimonadetes bacterium]|nr:dTMP kinase [Armatimonadota bacterium]
MRGKFITFEGVEGAGKTTHAFLLAEHLRGKGLEVVLTQEPGGTPEGERVRELLLRPEFDWEPVAELLLYTADRAQHVGRVIRPALCEGKWVVCDRFSDSTLAYQAFGLGLPRDLVERAVELGSFGLKPDLTIVLDIEAEEGLRRIGRGADRIEMRGVEFHRRVREGYLALAAEEPGRIFVVRSDRPVEEVHAEIVMLVERRLLRG